MTVLSTKTVKTKKPHECWWCCGIIPGGRNVEVQASVDLSIFYTTYTCEICSLLINHPYFDLNNLEDIRPGTLIQDEYYYIAVMDFESSGEKWSDAIAVNEQVREMIYEKINS